MLAALALDQFADVTKVRPEMAQFLQFRPGRSTSGAPCTIAIFPAGTVFSGDDALRLCKTGQARPADDECRAALGMSPEQIESNTVEYRMDCLGIRNEGDRALYRAGVILGYGENLEYIPGPNWNKYQAALAEANKQEEI